MSETSAPLNRPRHSFLRNVNLARSVGAHTTFAVGAVAAVFGVHLGHDPAINTELVMTGVGLWAAGLPLRSYLNNGMPRPGEAYTRGATVRISRHL